MVVRHAQLRAAEPVSAPAASARAAERGFSLIELMLVILIVSLLSTVVALTMADARGCIAHDAAIVSVGPWRVGFRNPVTDSRAVSAAMREAGCARGKWAAPATVPHGLPQDAPAKERMKRRQRACSSGLRAAARVAKRA